MRTKNKKWIGPVPIAAVAALALAAFISAGLWMTPGGNQTAQAQGLPTTTVTPETSACSVEVYADGGTTLTNGLVSGGKCDVGSGDSITVTLKNANESPDADTGTTGFQTAGGDTVRSVSADGSVDMIVYTTGGSDYPGIQATTGGADSKPIGKKGLNERTFNLERQQVKFGSDLPGSESFTVTRSMAGTDGKVYLFGYYNDDDTVNVYDLYVINGRVDVDGDGKITITDDHPGTGAGDGGDAASFANVQVIDGAVNVNLSTAVTGGPQRIFTDDNVDLTFPPYAPGDGVQIVAGVVMGPYTGTVADLGITGLTFGSDVEVHNGLLVDSGTTNPANRGVAPVPTARPAIAATSVDFSSAVIFNGELDIEAIAANGDPDAGGTGDDHDLNTDAGIEDPNDGAAGGIGIQIIDGRIFGPYSGPLPASIHNEDAWDRPNTHSVPIPSSTTTYFPGATNDGTTPVPADLVIEVVFVSPPDMDESEITVVNPEDGESTATVTVTLKDAQKNPVPNANVDLTLAAGSGATFENNREIFLAVTNADGVATADVSGLAKTGAVKVKVTAKIGNLTLEKYIERAGDPAMIETMAYGCAAGGTGDTDTDPCVDERAALGTEKKTDDPKPVGALDPGDTFFYTATVKDANGTKIADATVTAAADGADAAAKKVVNDALGPNTGLGPNRAITVLTAAMAGDHTIKVTSGSASAMVTVTVTGAAKSIAFSSTDDPIPASGVGAFTVKATDANGHLPNDLDTFRAVVSVRPDAKLLGTTGSVITFNEKTGESTFYVQVADDLMKGESVTITVTATGVAPVTVTVTYSEAQEPQPVELTKPTVSSVNPAGSGIAIVAWEKTPAATGYVIAAVNLNDGNDYKTMALNNPDSVSGSVTGLMKGETYLVFVVAFDAKGKFMLSAATQIQAE